MIIYLQDFLKELAVKIMEAQTNIGIKKINQKVMTKSMSSQFINNYKEAAKEKMLIYKKLCFKD